MQRVGFIGIFTLLLLVLFTADIFLGSVPLPFMEVLSTLFSNTEAADPITKNIIFTIRLPKALTAVLAGSSLSVAGLQMQSLFRNPLAGPSELGITAGAGLGVAVVTLSLGVEISALQQIGVSGSWLIITASISGSCLVFLLLILIARRVHNNVTLLIIGLMLSSTIISVISLGQFFSSPEQIREYLLWTFGSLGSTTSDQLTILSITISLGLLISWLIAKPLNLLLLGEEYARNLGVNTQHLRWTIILNTSLLSGAITAFCGPIGFIGIAVPHMARYWLQTSNHIILVPAVVLLGSCLILLCDILANLPLYGAALPINTLTALLGAPIVIWVAFRSGRHLNNP